MKELRKFIYDVVLTHAKIDRYKNQYNLNFLDLPDFIRFEIVAHILIDDNSWSHEALGPDNNNFNKKMLPSIIKYLLNTTNKDNEIEFVNSWRDSVTDYFKNMINGLIDEALYELNESNNLLYRENVIGRLDSSMEVRPW